MHVCRISTILEEHGFDHSKMLEGFEDYGLARVRAGDLRILRRLDGIPCPQGIMLAPTAREPWHAVVFDRSAHGARSKSVKKRIAEKLTGRFR